MAVLKLGSIPVESGGQDDPRGPFTAERISDAGNLSQFGALIEQLAAGSASSHAHWHEVEDEMIYLLSGTLCAEQDGVETRLSPGDAVCWKAGDPVAHRLINHSDAPARYMVIGSRAQRETVTYPKHDRILHTDRSTGLRQITTLDGKAATSIS